MTVEALRTHARRGPSSVATPARAIWAELGRSMRLLRESADLSLRRVEPGCGIGRGTLSQIETGKARPTRELVEWYDSELGGDGLLIAMYAEARGARGTAVAARPSPSGAEPGDSVEVREQSPPSGALVTPGERLTAAWTLVNSGSVPWRGRRVLRVGAHVAERLITSDPWTELPDCEPGAEVRAEVTITVPDLAGTYAAYWYVGDEGGHPIPMPGGLLSVVLVGADT